MNISIVLPLLFLVAATTASAQSNGNTSSPAPPANCAVNSVCFAYDMSGSISDAEYQQEVDAVVRIARTVANVTTAGSSTQYSAHGFTSSSVLVQAPTGDLEGVFIPQLRGFSRVSGGTSLTAGLAACFSSVRPAAGNRVVVLLTDGQDGGSADTGIAATMKAAGVKIVTVGIGSGVDAPYLRRIASRPAFYVETAFAQIVRDATRITRETCRAVAASPVPVPTSPAPVRDSCQAAYDACGFRFQGRRRVPTVRLGAGSADVARTPKIVSRMAGERVGVVNSNGITVEFIWPNGAVVPIANRGLPPTAFKPFRIRNRPQASGIGHQALSMRQKNAIRRGCVRVFISQYQTLTGARRPFVKQNVVVGRRANKCVVVRVA